MVSYVVMAANNASSTATGITRVQYSKGTTTSGTTVSVTMPIIPTAGNLLIAVIGADGTSQAVNNITERGVTWIGQVSNLYGNGIASSAIWVGVVGSSVSAFLTVTFVTPVYSAGVVNVCEYSGLNTTEFLDTIRSRLLHE